MEYFYSKRKVVFANFFIQIPSMHVARSLSSVVDSGSPFTSISTRDAITFGLPIKNWQKGEMAQLAGFKFYRHPIEATLSFKDAESKIISFNSSVNVLVPTKIDKSTIREVQNIPSLLGTDFLEDNGITFSYNPKA